MVGADTTLFSTSSSIFRATPSGVIAALLATEDLEALVDSLGALGVEGEGGSAPGSPQRDKKESPKFPVGASLWEQD